jgi:hypothetical protein
MAKKVREQIDYGNRPERMDPNLERKLSDPEGLYGKNPAMKKGPADVERLVSARFKKVADKLKQSARIQDLSPRVVQSIYTQMMSRIPYIMQIEAANKEELEQLAIDASLEETEIPEGWVDIQANLGAAIDVSNFRYQPEPEKEEDEEEKKEKLSFQSFEIEDLTDEEQLELEKHKRNIINAIIQGAAKRGHYIFQKPSVKRALDRINPELFPLYLTIMAVNDYMYFTQEQMIEMMSQTGQGVAGKVELDPDDEEEGDEGEEGGEEESDTVIKAEGLIFPILCHEIIKGIEESKGRHGLPKDSEMRQKVQGQVDTLANEPMQLRIGPEIVEKIRNSLPDPMFDDDNKGLINWFHILLYQIDATEFLEIIGNAISDDNSKNKKATQRFEEIMKEAMQMKNEFENYQEENDIDPNDGNDDDDDDDYNPEGFDDFLGQFGISRPK